MANVVAGIEADHHKYIIPGKIDVDVVREQSIRQADKEGESSVVHHHRHGESCEERKHDYYGLDFINE